MSCEHFDASKGYPPGVPNTEKEQAAFRLLNDRLCAGRYDGFEAISVLLDFQKEYHMGYKQLCLFAGLSASVHHKMDHTPTGRISPTGRLSFLSGKDLGFSKKKEVIPSSPELDSGPLGLPTQFALPKEEDPSLAVLVKRYSGSFNEPLVPVYRDGKWNLMSTILGTTY